MQDFQPAIVVDEPEVAASRRPASVEATIGTGLTSSRGCGAHSMELPDVDSRHLNVAGCELPRLG
jgi:hypothetical protein